MDPGSYVTKRRTDVSFLERKFRSLTLSHATSTSPTNVFGPLGLNLLFQPSETLVDFVFVHGLRGGSQQAWSFKPMPEYFWPQAWLPFDPDFRNVRIHSYGYNSDWADRREDSMTINDFGVALIEDVHNCPTIRRDQDTRIVFIAHSMGGLVVKKAVITSKINPMFRELGERIHALYFFGTPHRGADLATTLNNFLRATTSLKHFVTNLERGSDTTRVLNDQFRHIYQGIELHSFVETVPMTWHIGSGLIVDRESATMGLPEEHVVTLKADHRYMNKFETPNDENYRKVRDRLAATVDVVIKRMPQAKHQLFREQMSTLAAYLDVTHSPEDDLSSLEDLRLDGSCQWITNRQSYQKWQFDDDAPRYFWLKGPPATGKSVLAAHVIGDLEESRCSYYFFKHGDQSRASLSGFFRSMAYQMALRCRAVREKLLEVAQDDPFFDKEDHRSIWRRIFVNGVFRADFPETYYWVVDALDECSAAGTRVYDNFFSMLSKIAKAIPLKVFITSRPSTDLERLLAPLPKCIEQMTVEDTLEDIRLYVETYSENLPVTDDPTRRALIEKIVEKSSGSFLWTVVVMRQLDDIYSLQETEAVLEEVPEEMEPLYMRNLDLMSTKSKTTRLAKTVLTWAVCAQRAINIAELKHAIKLDINDVVARDLERSISSLCGQLVVIDKRSRVQLVHQTARTFLTNPLLESEFKIGAAEGHLHLALACLKYLTSDEMKFVRKQRRSVPGLTQDAPKRSALADYACLHFADHISRASSASDTLFRAITLFLQTNVLSWIERIAETHDLSPLLRTAKHFKAYLARRAKHVAPLQDDIRLWATDLPRIATEFGRNLLSLPSAIHLLIPPLCPRKSIIYRHFTNKTVGIRLQGLASSDWMDRIFCTYYRDKTAKVVVCQDQWFAAGLSDGSIVIYNTSTCAEVLTLSQNESVRKLQFGTVAKTLASAGRRFVKLWDVSSGSQRAQIRLNSDALAMFFDENESTLTIATRSKEISQWSVSDGKLIWSRSWTNAMQDSDVYMIGKVPTIVEISTEHKLVATVYKSSPVIIWDLEGLRQLGTCAKKSGALEDTAYQVTAVLFNPNPDINLIAIAYWDGDIALFDTYYMAMKSSAQADAQILAASSDGRTLATGNSSGKIQLFDFETLHLLYSISSSEESITAITFTSDNLRFLDVRGSQLNVWEPSVLVRNYVDDDRSEPSEGIAPLAGDTDVSVSKQTNAITSIVCCFGGSSAICGKTNGQVELYNLTSTDKTSRVLYKHKGSFMEISTLDWNEDQRVVASVDNSSRFQVVRLSRDADGKSAAECILLNDQLGFGDNVQQLLLCPGAMRLLVSTAQVDLLWSLQTKKMIARHQRDKISPWKWLNHPLSPSKIVLLMGNSIQFYSWESLEQVSRLVEIRLVTDYDDNFDVENTFFIPHTSKVVFKPLHKKQQSTPTGSLRSIRGIQLYAVDLSVLDSDVPVVIPSPFFSTHRISDLVDLDVVIGTVVGVFGGDILVFISKQGWVCSIDLNVPLPVGSLQRHFFVPFAWLSASAKVLAQATARRDIVFVHGDEVAVVQNGLDDVEIIDLS